MRLPYANSTVKHWNLEATMPLVLPLHLVCNTSDEEIVSNIRLNSDRRKHSWLKRVAEHDGVAVLCGSGPSLADTLPVIRERAAAGQTIFALNGAARYLVEQGLIPDYQVILDARQQTADLVEPRAKAHMFASQVHPDCFAKAPGATLWHLQIGGIDMHLPPSEKDDIYIGGAASVGNTATCVAYALGYRNLQCYGYDSSHRGEASHAFRQPMNDTEPCAEVEFNGKKYLATLTMKLQAEKFLVTSQALKTAGCVVEVHGDGLLPALYRAPKEILSEVAKYERLWWMDTYREMSPGEECVGLFIDTVKPDGGIIDFGCGTGRAAIRLDDLGFKVHLVDFTENSRDPGAMALPFTQADLREPIPVSAPYGFCADVMEHVLPEEAPVVIANIMASAPATFFQISTVPDKLGLLIGECLHLTVRPHEWWAALFQRLGYSIVWERREEVASLFYVGTHA